jgi:ribosomal protein S18 acetylase RimI-like enzyme
MNDALQYLITTYVQSGPRALRLLPPAKADDYMRHQISTWLAHDKWLLQAATAGRGAAIVGRLPFDSDCFGLAMARLEWFWATDPAAYERLIGVILADAKDKGIEHLTVRIEADQFQVAQVLVGHGFYLTDTQTTLAHRYHPAHPIPEVAIGGEYELSLFAPPHLAQIQELSVGPYRNSRFYTDPALSADRADLLHRRWVTNDCTGRADRTWVACRGETVLGYITCLFYPAQATPAQAHIDLVAVGEPFRGLKIGSNLVNTALRHYQGQADLMTVGTQGHNYPAINMYQKSGFGWDWLQMTFHFRF